MLNSYYLSNNNTVIEGLSVSIVDLTVANIRFTDSASRRQ